MTIDVGMTPGTPCDEVDAGWRSVPVLDHEWRVIRGELGQRRIVALRRKVLENGIDVSGLDGFLSTSSRVTDVEAAIEELRSLLLPLWNSLVSRPADCVLLSVFMYARCHTVWELNGDEERIMVGIRGLQRSWKHVATLADPSAELAVDLVVAHAQSLLPCVRVEHALRCSCPVAMASQASLISTECGRLLERCTELSPEWAGFREEFLAPMLRTHQLTYYSLREVAESVTAWAVQGRAAAPVLQRALQVIEQAERDPDVVLDVYANELRGHRASLSALYARITDPSVPDIRIQNAKVVYSYPFSITEVDGAEIRQRARQLAPDSFGPDRVFTVVETELSDIWDAQEKQTAIYRGDTIVLPGLTVETTGGDVITDHAVSIRLSELGNHYIRIEKPINNYTLHELNQAMRRAAPYMGMETVTEVGGAAGPWQQLPEYVQDLAARVRQAVWPESVSENECPPLALVTDADFHVLVEITAATVMNDDGTTVPATTRDILTAAGPVLSATLQRLPSALEEWARFGTLPPSNVDLPTNLVDNSFAFSGDFIGRTLNSTFLVVLDTPNWALIEHEERTEFVASLPPLIEGWRNELMKKVKSEQKDELSSLTSRELLDRRLKLQDRVREIQGKVALLHSVDLWKTLSSLRFGESLYAASGLDDIEAELTQAITRAELYYERLAALIAQKEEGRKRRSKSLIEIVLSVLAVASLADLLSLINQLFELRGRTATWVEVGILSVLVLVVVVTSFMVHRGRD
jgi:hypothetical protein